MPNQTAKKWPAPTEIFSQKTTTKSLAPLKKFLESIQSYEMCHFWTQNSPFILNKIFLVQTIIITFMYLLAIFTVQNLKKFFQRIQSYEDATFLGPKWPISPIRIFSENLLVSLVSSIHDYLHPKN